ncbi:MAG: sensor histidine kinase [Marmoricola sp.]
MRHAGGNARSGEPARPAGATTSRSEFWRTPARLRVYVGLVCAAALVLPFVLSHPVHAPHSPQWLTVVVLLAVSVLNVEVSRWLSGGVTHAQQPHKALSAWAFATSLLVPTWWLVVVVPVTYAHARWRGIRVPLWKWVGSGAFLIVCGLGAAAVRHQFLGSGANWSQGDGHRGFLTMSLACAVFLGTEALLFAGAALLNRAEDERWLRETLTSLTFYTTETGVLLLGGLFAMVWSAGFWFTVFLVPVYVLVQHAALLAPLKQRAADVNELAAKNADLARLNDELELKNAELDHAGQFKSDLMGMLGHEIGNPLTSVLGYAQVGVDAVAADDVEAMARALVVVERNAQQATAVLTEIVQLVASERGTLQARPEPVALAPCLSTATLDLPERARPRIECPDELAALVQPGHLHQILGNLLSNATKYAGGATLLSARASDGQVSLSVVDHGPGISPQFADHLFERYRRDEAWAAQVQGTGIGLYISRELARANGGELFHHHGEPHGSRFELVLPAAGT